MFNKLRVKDTGTTRKHIDCDFRGFICDRNTFDCFNNDGDLKAYRTINTFFRETSEYQQVVDDEGTTRGVETCQFFRLQPGNISDGNAPDFDFLTNKDILSNFAPDSFQVNDGDYLTPQERDLQFGLDRFNASGSANWDSGVPNSNFNPFHPKDDITTVDDRLTNIFSEDGQDNYIQIIIWLKSNQGDTGNIRRRRFYVFKVLPNEIMDFSGEVAVPNDDAGKPITGNDSNIPNRDGHKSKDDDECNKPAWYISEFSVTFNVQSGASEEEFQTKDQAIVNAVEPKNPISENRFDLDFTTINLFQEPYTTSTAATNGTMWRNSFTPFPECTIVGKLNTNLQGFKTDDLDRQICSAPASVDLKIHIAEFNQSDTDNEIFLEKAYSLGNQNDYQIPPYYKFCVVHWDDVDDVFTTIEDVFSRKPSDSNEIIEAQNDNTFIFKEHTETLRNTYTTPGIKNIKILVFSYCEYLNTNWDGTYDNSQLPPFNRIEPIRYKLLTSRIFLDIPISEFEDFGELGGSDYRTLPWPYTNPIIGGLSQDSKYFKTINDILGGGNIGNQDIIDETFLLEARDNDELGKNIEKMDLEQIRYFSKPYDMNTLLLLPTSGVTGWDDYDLAQQTDLIIVNQDAESTQYFGTNLFNMETLRGKWSEADYQLIFDGINEYTMYNGFGLGDGVLSDSNTFMNILLRNKVEFDGDITTPNILFYKTYGPSLDMEAYTSEEMVIEFFKNENFTPTLEELEPGNDTTVLFMKSRTNGTTGYYQGFGYFGGVDEVIMSTFQSGPEVYEEAAPRINLNPDGTPSSIEWLQILNKSNQDTQFSHPDFPVLFYYYQDMELYNENGEMRLTELKMGESVPLPVGMFTTIVIPDKLYTSDLINEIQFLNESISVRELFQLPLPLEITIPHPYTERDFWVSNPLFPGTTFPQESSVGQIFINDNQDLSLKQSCIFELNTGNLVDKSIYDSSGNANKGLLIGDYKLKKPRKNEQMKRDSSIKTPKKVGNSEGAL